MLFIKNAEKSDISDIMRIERASFIPEIQEDERVFAERIEIFPEGFLLLYDDENHSAAGYFCSELWKTVPDHSDFAVGHSIKKLHAGGGKILYISSFAILPEFRGRGIASDFFKRSLFRMREKFMVESEVLLVNENWLGARHIYWKSGFMETGRVRNAFPNGAAGLVMEAGLVR